MSCQATCAKIRILKFLAASNDRPALEEASGLARLRESHPAKAILAGSRERALDAPDTISSDLHVLNKDGPVFDQATTLSKFLCLGTSARRCDQGDDSKRRDRAAPPRTRQPSARISRRCNRVRDPPGPLLR
jgi:hypothetical protein